MYECISDNTVKCITYIKYKSKCVFFHTITSKNLVCTSCPLQCGLHCHLVAVKERTKERRIGRSDATEMLRRPDVIMHEGKKNSDFSRHNNVVCGEKIQFWEMLISLFCEEC